MATLPASRADLLQFARFLVVGGLNTVFGYAMFALATLIGLGANAAVIVSTVLGILFNYQSTGRLVFGSSGARLLPRFLACYAVFMLANIGLIHVAMAAGAPVLAAQALVLPPLIIVNFILMRRFVFRTPPPAETAPL